MTTRVLFTTALILGLSFAGLPVTAGAYPLDAYEPGGIRRLEYYRRIVTGEIQRTPVPRGARLPAVAVEPRLASGASPVPYDAPDEALGRDIARVLGDTAPEYSVAVVDLSDPANPVYAEHNGDARRNVGSVGKVLVGVAWFQLLADSFPDVADRERVMRDTRITADAFIRSDHHKVIMMDPETGERAFRTIREGDEGTLWDWIDWMLSASNNSAASTMQKQVVLLDAFGAQYPPTPQQEAEFFERTSRADLGKRFIELMTEPAARNGIDSGLFRQGSFFTREGKARVPGTSSYGNVREIVKLLDRVERGELVDAWSSREFKRLLYMTQRRIRYASHPVLNDFAVYFKSGSLYRCRPEEGFVCKQYAGNDLNLLGSVAIVEGPVRGDADALSFHYLVAVSSNVLRVNSAVAHQTLALRIHRLLEARRKDGPATPVTPSYLDFADVRLVGEQDAEPRQPQEPSSLPDP